MSGRRIGNYLVLDYLGGGGFGSVFKAEDTSTPGRIVAVKELHRKHTRSSVIKQRFFQEAIAMAKLDHPNLPRLFTFGEDHGSYYLVMEFLSGKLLTDAIQEKAQLPLGQAAAIISQVLEAVSYAHKNGIIHRDLKPDNIMLLGDVDAPHIKVLDFGIARMVGGENLTMAGEGFGTPVYMSPERISGSLTPESRADIYSLGIIFYEMLAGNVPFQSQATDPLIYWAEMRKMHETYPLPALDSLNVPETIEQIIRKATAKTLDDRYTTADDMLNDLRQAAGDGAVLVAASQTAQLALTTNPPAAEVYVDDVLRATSDDATGKVLIDSLSPGLHSVRVLKTGYNEYNISVVMENDKRTDLQVALAANATMVMPQTSEDTAPMDFKTLRMESGDEVETAMLTLEGVPAGSQIFVGAKALALAGEDGRATLKLQPGTHDVEVKSPTGATGTKRITLTEQDTGSFVTMAMPMTQTFGSEAKITSHSSLPASQASDTQAYGSQLSAAQNKKKMAMAAAVILLLVLVAGAYAVFSGLGRETPSTDSQAQILPAPQPPTAEPNQAASPTETENSTVEKEKSAIEREKQAIEKEKKDIEKQAKESPDNQAKPSQPPSTPPAPPEPEKPVATPPAKPAGGTACVMVRVTTPNGEPAKGVMVVVVSSDATSTKRTGPEGRALACDIAVGSKLTVVVKGAGMVFNGTMEAGGKMFQVTVNRGARVEGEPPDEPSIDNDFNRRRNKPFPRRNRPPV
jgi:serine/threonine protein kinase